MCLVVFSWKTDSKNRLTLLANRDEFFERPTESACFRGNTLSGKDLQCGGTWLGVSRQGKVAVITNFRDPPAHRASAKSRGLLVSDFLDSSCSAKDFAAQISSHRARYNPFNLLLYDGQVLISYSSQTDTFAEVAPGTHALSNHHLDSDWPKVKRVKKLFSHLLNRDKLHYPEDYLNVMEDPKQAEDSELPETGVSLEWEQRLSPIFIKSAEYGTRSTSLLLIDNQNRIRFTEKSHYPDRKSLITCDETFIVP
ncbi:MAG: hypothetical protein DRQ61_06210 [Gammaproteobacteria bacterium]|nr:MAG: hypothetical protein DRQ61_06210 [Gammaproteobacteria bacterium]